MPNISLLTSPYKLSLGSAFSGVFSVAINNAHCAGRKTVTPMDVKRVVLHQLQYRQLEPEAKQELSKMKTLRGVINNSGGIFARNGRLTLQGNAVVKDRMSFLESFERFFSACFKNAKNKSHLYESVCTDNKPVIKYLA